MSGVLMFRVCQLATLALVATGATLSLQEDGVIMRRQPFEKLAVQLGPAGELTMNQKESAISATSLFQIKEIPVQALLKTQKTGHRNPEAPYCDEFFKKGTDDSNDCPLHFVAITRQEDCRFAAKVIESPTATDNDTIAWLIDDSWVNPDPYPKNCFLASDGKVHFNPTNTNRTSGWKGTPLCQRLIYQNGTTGADSPDGCTGDYEPITNWEECHWAHDCQWGRMYCEEVTFASADATTADAPHGCYRNKQGCYGFNAEAADTPITATDKTPVCKLKDGPAFTSRAKAIQDSIDRSGAGR